MEICVRVREKATRIVDTFTPEYPEANLSIVVYKVFVLLFIGSYTGEWRMDNGHIVLAKLIICQYQFVSTEIQFALMNVLVH